MAEFKAGFPESSSVTTFFRTNLPGPRVRAKFGKLYHMPGTTEKRAALTTENPTEIETACTSSSQNETDSGYGTTSVDRDATKSTDPARTTLTFSRKPVPKQFLDRLFDIRTLYAEDLRDAVSKQRPTKDVSMKLKYGDHDDSLYLVIQCDKRDKKRIKKFFDQSHVKESIGNEITVYITTGLRLLATQALKVFGATLQTAACGTMIRIEGTYGSSVATLGGMIAVMKEGRRVIYGLTAGHALIRLVHNQNRPSRSSCSDIEKDSETPYSSDDSSSSLDDDQSEVSAKAHCNGASWTTSELISQIGNITEHSFQSTSSSTNHDWALVELHPSHPFSNLIHVSYPPEPCNEVHSMVLTLPSISTPTQLQANVIIPTSRGNQRGTLTSSTSSLLLTLGREFVETHDVVLDDGFSLRLGDSGSWVIHETTGEVFGHVVSMDMFGEICVMPFNHTLRDIQAHLHADHVGLPENTTGTWRPKVEINECSETLNMLNVANSQQMMRQPRSGPVEILRSIEAPATDIEKFPKGQRSNLPERQRAISDETSDSGYVTDFQRRPNNTSNPDSTIAHQMDNAYPPRVSPRYPGMTASSANIDSKIAEANYVGRKNRRLFCDQCGEKSIRFDNERDLQQHKRTKHQQEVKKFICVHPEADGLQFKTPFLIHPLDQCSACKAEEKYASYDNAAAHLRRVHFRERPLQPIGRHIVIASDSHNWPQIQELKSWIKEVPVDGVDLNPLISEEEVDATVGAEREDADNRDNQPEAGSSVKSVNMIPEPQQSPVLKGSWVDVLSMPHWRGVPKRSNYEPGIGSPSRSYASLIGDRNESIYMVGEPRRSMSALENDLKQWDADWEKAARR